MPTKGHWTKGKRRNVDRGDWQIIRLSLTALLEQNATVPGVLSIRALADVLGVSAKSVMKWINGTNRPDEDTQGRIATWIRQTKTRLKIK